MANFYKKPFIYLPKKKAVSGGNQPTPTSNFGYASDVNNNIGVYSTGASYHEFYIDIDRIRSSGAAPLNLYGKDMYYYTGASAARVLRMVHIKVNDTDANIEKTVFNNRFGTANLQYIYLYYNDSGTWKLAKITPDFNYRQQLVQVRGTVSGLPSGTNGYVYGVYLNANLYSNFRNNSTIQSKIQSNPNTAYILAFSAQVSDAEVINVMHTYGWTWASGQIDEVITL